MSIKKKFIGLMSGTSADSIDAVLIALGCSRFEILLTHSIKISADMREQIYSLAIPGSDEIHRLSKLDKSLGLLFSQAANELLTLSKLANTDITAIGSHGQTIRHHPPSPIIKKYGGYSLQVGDPNIIAEKTGITTVANFRGRDMALGGQGAPLVPGFHKAFFEKTGSVRAIVNIGGISNITLLPGDGLSKSVLGYDTGPGNGLMDKWTKINIGKNYDKGGAWAAQGVTIKALLSNLMDTPYLFISPPKSTGPELFNIDWLKSLLEQFPKYRPVDIQATLLEFTAQTISQALSLCSCNINEVFICGGGAYNIVLINRLRELLAPVIVENTSILGIAPEWVEASAFAWLAKQTIEGLSGNMPAVTGAEKSAVLGAIYTK
jgi:anhydro-N-acetylmuramic acid kinase